MRILILEDNMSRVDTFRKKLFPHAVTHVVYAKEAIELLQKEYFDVIFLDHDLYTKDAEAFDPNNCGLQVAEFIRDKKIRSKVIVHSLNLPRALKMTFMIPQASCIPWAWDFADLIMMELT